MEIFEEHKLIEFFYQVLAENKICHINKLLLNSILQGFIIFEKLLV